LWTDGSTYSTYVRTYVRTTDGHTELHRSSNLLGHRLVGDDLK